MASSGLKIFMDELSSMKADLEQLKASDRRKTEEITRLKQELGKLTRVSNSAERGEISTLREAFKNASGTSSSSDETPQAREISALKKAFGSSAD